MFRREYVVNGAGGGLTELPGAPSLVHMSQLERPSSPNTTQQRARTAVLLATEKGNVECVRELLQINAGDLEARDENNLTPLLIAARNGSTAIVRLLLEAGSDVTATNSRGETVLHLSATSGNVATLQLLLQQTGVSINARDLCGNTPLLGASSSRDDACAIYLLQRGANLHAVNDEGATALTLASAYSSSRLTETLLSSGARLEASSSSQPWIQAIEHDNASVLPSLLGRGARNMDKLALLNLAIARQAKLCLDKLVGLGLHVSEARRKLDDTPLVLAVRQGNPAIVDLLLDAGMDVNRGSPHAPLYECLLRMRDLGASRDRIRVLRRLLVDGANVDSCPLRLRRPMQLAVMSGSVAVVTMMLVSGASISLAQLPAAIDAIPRRRSSHGACKEIGRRVRDWLIRPQSLRHICRLRFRRALGTNVNSAVAALPVSRLIKNFLLLEELDDIVDVR